MKKKQTKFESTLAILIVLLVLAISCTTGCSEPESEEYYEAVQETFPDMVIVGDPDTECIWFAVDTTVQPNRYFVCRTQWTLSDRVSSVKRLYVYPEVLEDGK